MIPGVNIISGKVSVANINGAGEGVGVEGALSPSGEVLGGRAPKKTFRL